MRRLISNLKTLSMAALIATSASTSFAQGRNDPGVIPLQGQLSGQQANEFAEDGVYTISVRVYEQATGSEAVWQDTYRDLPVINGVFNIMLGSQVGLGDVTSSRGNDLLEVLDNNGVLYVGLSIDEFDGNEIPNPVEMLPRLSLVPVPYSTRSGDATKLLGEDWSNYFDDQNRAFRAISSDEVNLLDGYDWDDLLTGVPSDDTTGVVGAGVVSDPENTVFPQGAQIRDELLPAPTSLGATLTEGAIIEQLGGAVLQAIDVASLDSNGNGIPDRSLRDAKNILGLPIVNEDSPTTYTLWFLCNNANNFYRFPDPNAEDAALLESIRNEYRQYIAPHLWGASVPSRPSTVSGGQANYQWRLLEWDGSQAQSLSSIIQSGNLLVTYDEAARVYWVFHNSDNDLDADRLFVVSRTNDSRMYKYREITGLTNLVGGSGIHINNVRDAHVFQPEGESYRLLLLSGGQVSTSDSTGPSVIKIEGSDFDTVTIEDSFYTVPGSGPEDGYGYGNAWVDAQNGFLYHITGVPRRDGSGNVLLNDWSRDAVKFDIAANLLTEVDRARDLAEARTLSLISYDPNNRRIIQFGGVTGGTSSCGSCPAEDDLFSFDLTTLSHTELTPTGSEKPQPRVLGVSFFNPINGRHVIFAGTPEVSGGTGVINDLWEFDFNDNRWYEQTMAIDESTAIQTPVQSGYNLVDNTTTYDTRENALVYFDDRSDGSIWELRVGGKVLPSASIIKVGQSMPPASSE